VNEAELELLLVEWGMLSKYLQNKPEGATTDFHALQRAREYAPGTRARAAMRLVGRDGFDRRTMMAAAANAGLGEGRTCGIHIVPASFVDPVPCSESRRAGGVSGRARDATPPHLRPVEQAAKELYRLDTLRGLVLRQEYCGYGPQTEKAERVSVAIGSRIGLRVYRESLAHAKGWMQGRLAA
jgi:hypothetical protein